MKGKLSTDEKDALVSYSGKADINGTLRYDLEPHAKEAAQIKAMDTAISKSPLKQLEGGMGILTQIVILVATLIGLFKKKKPITEEKSKYLDNE